MKLKDISRNLSKVLRHDPEGLNMDPEGWVLTIDILNKYNIILIDLEDIVINNDKKRFMFNEDKSKIRATQGHSKGIASDKEFKKLKLEDNIDFLYHGTSLEIANKIKNSSINTGNRNHVHWTLNKILANKRANQRDHNSSILIKLNVKEYIKDGYDIFISENDVYLTEEVNCKYLLF